MEKAKIRRGKDIAFAWKVTTNGHDVPFEGRDIKLEIRLPNGHTIPMEFEAEGNTIRFTFLGVDQHFLGIHSLILWENFGQHGQTLLDHDGFELVSNTSLEDPGDLGCSNLETESADLGTSNLIAGIPGPQGKPGPPGDPLKEIPQHQVEQIRNEVREAVINSLVFEVNDQGELTYEFRN